MKFFFGCEQFIALKKGKTKKSRRLKNQGRKINGPLKKSNSEKRDLKNILEDEILVDERIKSSPKSKKSKIKNQDSRINQESLKNRTDPDHDRRNGGFFWEVTSQKKNHYTYVRLLFFFIVIRHKK